MTAFALKFIAVAAMIIDHVGVVFPDSPFWFRAVGRLAWPIFAYLIAEGFRHSKAPDKFLLRLLAFAVISEIPFDVVMSNEISFFANTNIFYTLFLGAASICLYERFSKKYSWVNMAFLLAVLPTTALGEILSVDYGGFGVLFIFVMYAAKGKILRLFLMTGFVMAQFLPLYMACQMGISVRFEYLMMIPFALLTVPLIVFYNGKRGFNSNTIKHLFYMVYPIHLTVLAVLSIM